MRKPKIGQLQPISSSVKIVNILAAFGACLIITPIGNWITNWIDPFYTSSTQTNNFYPHANWQHLAYALVSAPLWEEAVFRHFPLQIVKLLRPEVRNKVVIPTVLLTSIIWGFIHNGVPTIWIQGMAGPIFSWLYIKNGYDIKSSITVHFLWNLYINAGVIYLA